MSRIDNTDTQNIFNAVRNTINFPDQANQYAGYIRSVMMECITQATNMGKSINGIGNMSGDWFEMLSKIILEEEIGDQNITIHVGDGQNHRIRELDGFAHVRWIPYPDAIIRNERNLQATLSIKWGMRHDRMYEVAYSAYAINEVLTNQDRPPIHSYLFTNDDSASRLATMLEIPMITNVYHLAPREIQSKNPEIANSLRRLKSLTDMINDLRILTS